MNAQGSISKQPTLDDPVKIPMNQTMATDTMLGNERLHVQIDAVALVGSLEEEETAGMWHCAMM